MTELEQEDVELMLAFKEMLEHSKKYEITIQFWGDTNNVYIAKDGVELKDFGGHMTPIQAIEKTTEYLNRINRIKK